MTKVNILALDGSLRNFGVAKLSLDVETGALEVLDLILLQTAPEKNKKVRASSALYGRAASIAQAIHPHLAGNAACFMEVPSGGQSYDAVMGFGITIGLYAYISNFVNTIEVSPTETKKAALGTSTASKEEIIEWAAGKFPDAPWRTHKKGGEMLLNKDNEHLADAVAIAHAGIKLPVFKQAISILRAHAA